MFARFTAGLTLPKILSENGCRLYFYSDEGFEPVHVHVEYQGATAKFWVAPVQLASNQGLNGSELNKAATLVRKHERLVMEKWIEFFSKKV